jgi:hypothetical protein
MVAAAAGFMIAIIGGLLLSVSVGRFGFMDSLAAPYGGLSLGVESAGPVVLTVIGTALYAGMVTQTNELRTWSRRRRTESSSPARLKKGPLAAAMERKTGFEPATLTLARCLSLSEASRPAR